MVINTETAYYETVNNVRRYLDFTKGMYTQS